MKFNAFSICIIFEIFLNLGVIAFRLNDILNSKSVSETNHVIFFEISFDLFFSKKIL